MGLGVLVQAQDKILFTVNNTPVYAEEFVRVYNKNLDLVQDESQKDVDTYLDLYINYKLKLEEAKAEGLDQQPSYVRELDTYKKQLAKNYLTDKKVTDELIDEAYERSLTEIKASHILIRLPENANPADTLKVYNELLRLRDRVVKEGYKQVQKEVHNGSTIFAEDLGYFSAFKMVYDFENAAYDTEVGEVSLPFRTRFGYHIVYVQEKRRARGEVSVGHIMISNRSENPDTRINEVYSKLTQGEEFEDLAKQFSEDKGSAAKGGRLDPFSSGQLTSQEFEDVAFKLKENGDISEPFRTQFGWHIVKLYDKKPIKSFEEFKPELEVKIKRDSRSQLINESRLNKLKETYSVKTNQEGLNYFTSIMNDDFYKHTWTLPKDFPIDKTLVTIGDEDINYNEFGQYLTNSQRRGAARVPLDRLVNEQYITFLNDRILRYQEENLESENKEYANIVNEYREGLLLFDVMEEHIWNAAKTDTIAIKEFYNINKDDYQWHKRAQAVVASCSSKKEAKKVTKMFEAGTSVEDIKQSLNTENEINVMFTTGMMEAGHQALPENFDFKTGVSKVYKYNNGYVVADVSEVIPVSTKSYEEAKGSVVSDYQNAKEEEWLQQLKAKYEVDVNQKVLKEVKNQIKNQ